MTTTGHIVAGLFVSLDGVAKAPQKWQGPYFHPDTGATIAAELAEADALLLGRRTYEEFAGSWPQAGAEPMADRMNTIPKLVASSTLDRADWQNTTVLGPDQAAELHHRVDHGEKLTVTGSITLVRWLLRVGLLDELALMVHPVVLGDGRRLFDGAEPTDLALTQTRTYPTGVVSLTYRSAS
jgi:dihydrofolate reductase